MFFSSFCTFLCVCRFPSILFLISHKFICRLQFLHKERMIKVVVAIKLPAHAVHKQTSTFESSSINLTLFFIFADKTKHDSKQSNINKIFILVFTRASCRISLKISFHVKRCKVCRSSRWSHHFKKT